MPYYLVLEHMRVAISQACLTEKAQLGTISTKDILSRIALLRSKIFFQDQEQSLGVSTSQKHLFLRKLVYHIGLIFKKMSSPHKVSNL